MQLTDWLLVEVALVLIGLTQISFTKYGFNQSSVMESLLWLPPLPTFMFSLEKRKWRHFPYVNNYR
jgi:hypothetical protein